MRLAMMTVNGDFRIVADQANVLVETGVFPAVRTEPETYLIEKVEIGNL